ncbi:MAG: rhodanese-like domain-containing protein [Saprospiraceae bacterium]|nr:rhodanese-like domain-containing protein [Saprospiraceae bacterium]
MQQMLKQVLFSLLFYVLAQTSVAQVQSKAYGLMLQSLLDHTVPEVSVHELADKQSNALFLDSREPKEFAVSHIKGAVNVGYDHFDIAQLPKTNKTQKIVVYCSVGYRSEKVAEKLLAAGYSNVSNLYGGLFEWVNEGLPIVDSKENGTEKVHAYSPTWGIWLNKGQKVY